MTRGPLGIIAPHPPIMVPQVGGDKARVTSASIDALQALSHTLEAHAVETLVLMSPHAPVAGAAFVVDRSERFAGSLSEFGAPGARHSCAGDPELAGAILAEAAEAGIPAIDRADEPRLEPGILDHGALVPLHFLDPGGRFALVEISLSFLPLADHRSFGRAIYRAAARCGRSVAFVASGDCSHRLTPGAPAGFSPRAAQFDALLVELVAAGAWADLVHIDPGLIGSAGECGLRSFVTLGGFLASESTATRVLAYESPWGVGYLTAVASDPDTVKALPEASRGRKGGTAGSPESEPVALARQAIETFVRERRVIRPEVPPGLLSTRQGAFVSLHRGHDLRGCIGTIAPTADTLAEEIIHNAIQAATADPRFPALGPDELADLEISVDVLHEPEATTMAELDPSRFGVIVSCDWRVGLLLPDLEGVDTAEQQVSIATRKAGLTPGERVKLERFRVDRYT